MGGQQKQGLGTALGGSSKCCPLLGLPCPLCWEGVATQQSAEGDRPQTHSKASVVSLMHQTERGHLASFWLWPATNQACPGKVLLARPVYKTGVILHEPWASRPALRGCCTRRL